MDIIQQLQSTTGLAYICSNPIQEKCWVCKKIFDRLSSDWVYKTRVGTSSKYLCSYRCWRAADKKKPSRLRGEKVAQDRIDSGKERNVKHHERDPQAIYHRARGHLRGGSGFVH